MRLVTQARHNQPQSNIRAVVSWVYLAISLVPNQHSADHAGAQGQGSLLPSLYVTLPSP